VKKGINNELKLVLPATKGNAMVVNKMLSAFLSTIDDIDDVKSADIVCAVDEAVNNVVDHAYVGNNYECDDIVFEVKYTEDKITIFVTDKGVGIKDLQQARLSISGVVVDPTNNPISIKKKEWNYISYLPNKMLSVETALSGYEPQEGDIIK
jgi:anti-sigma regulatory factor (Ser/Thr protein kinase)